jgi:hypothetical protein
MPTRRVDGVLLGWTCGCRLAIGVEMKPSYRLTIAYIDNDDWVVGGRLTTHFEQQSPVDVWKFKSVHSLAFLLSLSPVDFSRQRDRTSLYRAASSGPKVNRPTSDKVTKYPGRDLFIGSSQDIQISHHFTEYLPNISGEDLRTFMLHVQLGRALTRANSKLRSH